MIETYGQFKEEAKKVPEAKALLELWHAGKIALYPAIDLYNYAKENTPELFAPKQLTLGL